MIEPSRKPSPQTASTRAGGARSLWRDWTVLGWAVGEAVSSVGDQVWLVALTITAVRLGDGGLAGTVLACAALPRALFMLVGGAISDRVNVRSVMLWSNAVRTLVLAVAWIVYQLDGATPALLISVGVCFGIADAFYSPASRAFPRQLVEKDQLIQLAGARQLLLRIASFCGAPLGGLVVTTHGLGGAILLDAGSFVFIALVLTGVRPRIERPLSARRASLLGDIRDGLAYLKATPTVRSLVIALSGLNVFATPITVIGVALRSSEAGWGAAGLGVLIGLLGAGAGLGTLVTLFWKPRRPVRAGLLLLLVQAVALSLTATGSFAVTVGLMVVIGATAGLASPMLAGTFQATVGPEYLGRTGAVISITDSGLTPLTLAGFGFLAAECGTETICLVFGLTFFCVLATVLSRPRVRALGADGTESDTQPEAQVTR